MAQVTMYGFWRSLAAYRVRVALNLKSISYDEPMIDLLKGEQFSAHYKAVNPQSVVPALDLHDGKKALFQSLAILEYLDESHPNPPLMPKGARDRARVRGLALIAAADTHPLVVPRIRNYLEHDLKLDEPARMVWLRRWIDQGSQAIETHLASDGETGKFSHGDTLTIADICLASHWVGAKTFGADTTSFPVFGRVIGVCMTMDAFAKAHPTKQPGAPAS